MTDVATNPAAEDEAVFTEEVASADTDLELEDGAVDELLDDQAPDDDEYEAVERNGRTAHIPKWLKGELLMQADYTRKTQEVAERGRAIEAREAEFAQAVEAQQEYLGEVAEARAIRGAVDSYADTDWEALGQQDPDAAQAHWNNYQQLQAALGQAEDRLRSLQEQRAGASQQEFATRVMSGYAQLPHLVPGWSQETEVKIADFARGQGFSQQDLLHAVADPRLVAVLNLARLGHEAGQARARTERVKASQKTTPAPTVRGASGRFAAAPDTSDFAAFEKMADERLRA